MDLRETLTIVFSGMVGTIGFSILFRSDKKRILCNAIGGALTCFIYVACCHYTDNLLIQNFFPALFASIYAEVMARAVKAPATPILACSIIPLVPGGKLYYTTYYFVTGDTVKFASLSFKIPSSLAYALIIVVIAVL